MQTNEELAQRIKAGERELLPELWESVRRFAYKEALRWCRAWAPFRPGLELDDLTQCGYIAMCAAIDTYDPNAGGFLTWLKFWLLTAFSREVGCRTPAQLKRPENNAISLESPIGGENESVTLGDVVADTDDWTHEIEEKIYQEQIQMIIRNAISDLPERQRDALTMRYLEGKTQADVAKKHHTALSLIGQDERKAFQTLQRRSDIRELYFQDRNLYRGTSFNAWRYSGCSVEEAELLRLERLERHTR